MKSIFKDVSCPSCHAKLCSIYTTMNHRGSHVCMQCKHRIFVIYDYRTGQIKKNIER